MAERIALLYELGSAVDMLDSLERTLVPVGLRLTHPSSGRVVLLDDEGEPMEVAPEELRLRLLTERDVRFQWWFTGEHDVYCRVRQEGGIRIAALGMEGCSEAELEAIGTLLQDRFVSGGAASVGLVFDPQGATEDYDWDRFFVQKEELPVSAVPDRLPEALGVTKPDLGRLGNLLSRAAVLNEGSLVIVRPAHSRSR